MTISRDNGYGTTYVFEVVDKIPSGYQVWNVPREGLEGYLPVCQVRPGTHDVIRETLKAVRMPEDEVLTLSWASMRYGASTLAKAEKILGRPWRSRKLIELVVDLFRKYS